MCSALQREFCVKVNVQHNGTKNPHQMAWAKNTISIFFGGAKDKWRTLWWKYLYILVVYGPGRSNLQSTIQDKEELGGLLTQCFQ